MARYGLVCDIGRCCGCYACFLSCRDEFSGKDHLPTAAAQADGQLWLNVEEIEYGEGRVVKVDYFPKICQHCQDPACMKGAPEGSVYKRDDGIVIIDPEKAKGVKSIAENCPYGVVSWDEDKSLPQKCTLCAHMIDEGEKTVRCAECCPCEALVFGDLDDPDSAPSRALKAKTELVEVWKPDAGTSPGMQYIEMPKPFIAGEVFYEDRTGEPAKDVKITLSGDRGYNTDCLTDCFGDFEFTRLEGGQKYILLIEAEGYKSHTREIVLDDPVNLGAIALSPGKND